MAAQKSRQIAGDCRVGCIGQAELLKTRLPRRRTLIQSYAREETFEDHLLDLHSAADQTRADARQIECQPFGRIGAEHGFFQPAGRSHEQGPLSGRQLAGHGFGGLGLGRGDLLPH